VAQLRAESEQDLRDCISDLERHVLRGTLVAERDLARQRLGENSHEPPHRRGARARG
jgi:hypothetical protein